MKKSIWFLAAIIVLVSCKGKKGEIQEVAGDQPSNGFSTEQAALIDELSVLECEIYTKISAALVNPPDSEADSAIRKLRTRRIESLARVASLFPDSASKAAFTAEMDRRKSADDYCPGMKELQRDSTKGKTAAELNIRGDAKLLAVLNCRILKADTDLKSNPANRKAAEALKKIRLEKKTLMAKLVSIYGPEILKDKSFRALVKDAQDSTCNFTEKVSGKL
ncbi:MAG TPA: hypothetical protein P5228_10435 [Bacteroidales bacterium]|nr:hypothetical protein [Bacteroidales bacterium]HRZ48292.1 hypothetical protein [Bacteroidales bacterium]